MVFWLLLGFMSLENRLILKRNRGYKELGELKKGKKSSKNVERNALEEEPQREGVSLLVLNPDRPGIVTLHRQHGVLLFRTGRWHPPRIPTQPDLGDHGIFFMRLRMGV